MQYLIDLIILAIIALTILISAKRGFVRIVIETVGLLLAVFITFSIHTPLATATYEKMVAPAVSEALSSAVNNSAEQTAQEIWEKLPGYVKDNPIFPGVSKETLTEAVGNAVSSGENMQGKISDALIKPTAIRVLSLIYAAALMAVFSAVVRLAATALNRVFSFKLAGRINTVLGAALGLLRGMISAGLFCVVISLLVSFTKDGFWIFTPEALEASWFFSIFEKFPITLYYQ